MLSRVAESLYWTARYVERAELMSRLVHVKFHSLLDSDQADPTEAWRRLLYLGGSHDLYREHHDAYGAETVSEFLLRGRGNPNSVVACIARARENARGVRDQISTEMWEELNRLHLYLATSRLQGVNHAQHQLFVHVRQSSHAFTGVTHATLPRGDAFELLQLGAHIERADVTARILAVEYPGLTYLPPDSLEETVRLTSLLKACGAFEAFRKAERSVMRAPRVLEYLLLDRLCPRTVLFCLEECRQSLERIAGSSDRPERAIGRLASELSFLEMADLHDEQLGPRIDRILEGIAAGGGEIAAAYFATRVLVPGAYAQAQQQQ
jgi:uncharacterized alpha-E superfamily protein